MNLPLKLLKRSLLALVMLVGPLSPGAPTVSASDGALPVEELDTRPVLLAGKPPQYPREMRKSGISGYVVVEFVISSRGEVARMQVLESSHREFEMPALVAVKDWKFEPGRKGKAAATVRAVERLEFAAPKKQAGSRRQPEDSVSANVAILHCFSCPPFQIRRPTPDVVLR